MTAIAREQQRLIALAKSGLSGLTSIGVFETAAHEIVAGMSTAIGAIGSIDSDSITYQGVALAPYASRSFLAKERNFPRRLLPCGFLLEQDKTLCINDLAADPDFADCPAIQEFGIRAYLGVPLRNASGDCLGTIEAIDLAPRHFTRRDIQLLELIGRNLTLELERAPDLDFLAADHPTPTIALSYAESDESVSGRGSFDRLRFNLVDRLVQDLRTPLTSVLGMTSVLNQEIYGALRPKQKEYLSIVHDSGQQMLSMVDSLIALQDLRATLSLTSINIETLCQQLVNRLSAQAERRSCRIDVSFDLQEGNWPLDRVKVDLALFHLLTRTINASDEGCTVRLHTHNLDGYLRFEVWVAHPWLGDSLPLPDLVLLGLDDNDDVTADLDAPRFITTVSSPIKLDLRSRLETGSSSDRSHLSLLLSCYLFEQHGGCVSVVGCELSGYRYVLDLPKDVK
ncbi:MAG: GAF domain-containing sensor histidine kinase [Coleofasciculaceae cyanobacterium RL_1_1]|nr:GAF domain-containing sensor histidine kinase [Coleofasciculaceae cyanobacterium RL_1_1]